VSVGWLLGQPWDGRIVLSSLPSATPGRVCALQILTQTQVTRSVVPPDSPEHHFPLPEAVSLLPPQNCGTPSWQPDQHV